jgi:hypothetical protein
MERQLRFWRERKWFQRAREERWAQIRKDQNQISVNTESTWSGVVHLADDDDEDYDDEVLLGLQRSVQYRQCKSIAALLAASMQSLGDSVS